MQNIRAAVVCFCARIRCSVWFYVMKQSMCGTPVPVHQIICPSYNLRVTQTWSLPYLLFLWVRQPCCLMCALWAYTVSASSCSICRRMPVSLCGEQMDSAPSLLLSSVLLARVWHERATGHGNQRRVMSAPTPAAADLPLVWVVGICFVYGPSAAWRSFSLRTLEGRELLQIWLAQALRGEVSRLWPLLESRPVVWLHNNGRYGMDVYWVVMFCLCVRPYAGSL